jgi:hypothetical protein
MEVKLCNVRDGRTDQLSDIDRSAACKPRAASNVGTSVARAPRESGRRLSFASANPRDGLLERPAEQPVDLSKTLALATHRSPSEEAPGRDVLLQ